VSLTEGEDTEQRFRMPPSVAFGATSPLRGKITSGSRVEKVVAFQGVAELVVAQA
jgi:hypothetical protein